MREFGFDQLKNTLTLALVVEIHVESRSHVQYHYVGHKRSMRPSVLDPALPGIAISPAFRVVVEIGCYVLLVLDDVPSVLEGCSRQQPLGLVVTQEFSCHEKGAEVSPG